MMIEVIEHLEAPWGALRKARAARRAGRLDRRHDPEPRDACAPVWSSRCAGNLTSFRPDYEAAHLPRAAPRDRRILREEGLAPEAPRFAGADVISLSGGRVWPERIRRRFPALTSVSLLIAANRDTGPSAPATSPPPTSRPATPT